MQPPTFTGIRIRTARDAEVIFHAVALGILPMVARRLDSEERMSLSTGCVYVWEERSSHVSESIEQGIERFTEGRSWGPSRARDDFLFYHEKDNAPKSLMVERTRALRYQEDPTGSYMMYPRRQGERMIKQTYSVYINGHAGMKKWHLNAYWTQETLDELATVDDFPQLSSLRVPEDLYICARTNRMRENAAKSARSASSPIRGLPTYAPYPYHPHPHPSPQSTLASPYSLSPSPLAPPLSPATSPSTSASASCSSQQSWSPPPPTQAQASSLRQHTPTHSSCAFPPPPPFNAHRDGLRLAPLEQLEGGRRLWRDPADEMALRTLNRLHR